MKAQCKRVRYLASTVHRNSQQVRETNPEVEVVGLKQGLPPWGIRGEGDF